MPCFHPLPAWRSPLGVVSLREPIKPLVTYEYLRLPCGGCIGCRKARAREWALRCTLELQAHDQVCWTTLTYDDKYLPPSLRKDHLQGWVKRLRKRLGTTGVRFFAAGEYGETTHRPHYHAILYGVAESSLAIQAAWPYGYARVDPLTPAAISYVAGYCSKKLGWKLDQGERIDYRTGELYDFQPPFTQMSRRPGIGGHARRFTSSWRSHAVLNGSPMPVPRFLHAAWADQATDAELLALKEEKALLPHQDSTRARLIAGEAIAIANHAITASKRNTL